MERLSAPAAPIAEDEKTIDSTRPSENALAW